MSNEKNKVEALLFTTARRMTIDEISKITGITNKENVKNSLTELKADYEQRGTSVVLQEDEGFWKLTVKDHYLPMVQRVVSQTELDKPLIETLAVIAWRYPILQADVIKIRHNKAYEHLKILEEIGFITRNRFGRTNKITLTQKFFEYFDLPTKEQVKEVFKQAVPKEVQEEIERREKEIAEGEKKLEEIEKKKIEMEENKETEEELKQEIREMEIKEEEKIEEIKETEKELEEQEHVTAEMSKMQK